MFHRTAWVSEERDSAFWLALAPAEAYALARTATVAAMNDRGPGVPLHEHLEASASQSRVRDALAERVGHPSPGIHVIAARGFEYARSLAHSRRPLSPERRYVEITEDDLRDGIFLALIGATDSGLYTATREFHAALDGQSHGRNGGKGGAPASPSELTATHRRFRRTVEEELQRGLRALQ